MTATNIVVLFLVLGYIAFLAWILRNSHQAKPKADAREDVQATPNRDTRTPETQRKVA
jgi:hypothetical protein